MTPTDIALSLEAELSRGTSELTKAGIPSPRREAMNIWSNLARTTPPEVWLRRHSVPDTSLIEGFRQAISRRCSGEPLPYVTATSAFRFLELEIDDSVLIPRPETEGLVDLALAWAQKHPARESLTALEIGVGSGCIVLSLSTEGPFHSLVGVERSVAALGVARRNLARIQPRPPVELREGNFYEPVSGERFDLIISNPPYISESEYETLDRSVRDHEPYIALVSPDNGMQHIGEICTNAVNFLNPGGMILLEIDERRGQMSSSAAVDAGLTSVSILPDVFGYDRYLRAFAPVEAS